MKSTRRQFLVQSAKAGLAIAAGVLGGLGLANRPRPTYEVPADPGFTAEGWVRTDGRIIDTEEWIATHPPSGEWVHLPVGESYTEVFYPTSFEVGILCGPPDGKMHHGAATWDGENITQWLDGERVPNASNS